jgi:glycine cleavage system H protein
MLFPKELLYHKTDEWVRVDGDTAIAGISDYAQSALSDVVYVELAVEVGDTVTQGDTLATLESVKAAADVNIPVSGTVIEINETLSDAPEILNSDPYGAGWIAKIKLAPISGIDNLLDAESYEKFCQER